MSVLGIVYDVGDDKGRQFFAPPEGPYRAMAGRDATYMLATMSLKAGDADKFGVPYDADDRQALAEWIAYFDASYPRVGWLIGPAPHSIGCASPPTARKRMGDTTYGATARRRSSGRATPPRKAGTTRRCSAR